MAKNLSHIASMFGFLCAASIASRDFHSETSTIVPSRARIMIGIRAVTSASLCKVGTRLYKFEKFRFFSGPRPIRHDGNHADHTSRYTAISQESRKTERIRARESSKQLNESIPISSYQVRHRIHRGKEFGFTVEGTSATPPIASSSDKQSLRRRGFSTNHPAVLPMWK
jgi:hypothetical protein